MSMRPKDPDHWLYRLDSAEWLSAAQAELSRSQAAFVARQQRGAVAQARRAAGMALNALLCRCEDPAYGRSYMDHLKALSADPAAAPTVQAAAQRLLEMPLQQELVSLGRGAATQAEPAEIIIQYVLDTLQRLGPAGSA